MSIVEYSIDELTLDPRNARTHSEANLEAIAGSLRTFGQVKPIVVTAAGVVIAGNGTVMAVQSLGWDTVKAIVTPPDWTDEQAMAYALADNRTAELAAWDHVELSEQLTELQVADFDIEAIGFGDYEVLNVRPDEVENPFALLEDAPRKDATQMTFTVSLEQGEIIKQVLAQAKQSDRLPDDGENSNSNGNALFLIVSEWPG